MKKRILFLALLCMCLSLTAGCARPSAEQPMHHEAPDSSTAADSEVLIEDEPPQFITCRIVDGAENGVLTLAEHGAGGSGVYTLGLGALPEGVLPEEPLRSGQLVNVYYGAFTETWPMGFGGVTAIEIVEGNFDNLCSLYLKVLEDLWSADPALSEGVEFVGIDLSQASLSPSEQSAVGWIFAGNHGAELLVGSVEELAEQGWITATPLSTCGSGTDLSEPEHFFYEWENGCHFSIAEQPMEGTYSLVPVTFDATKWRSSLGAYMFCGCTAVQSALGEWSDYTIESEVIS